MTNKVISNERKYSQIIDLLKKDPFEGILWIPFSEAGHFTQDGLPNYGIMHVTSAWNLTPTNAHCLCLPLQLFMIFLLTCGL